MERRGPLRGAEAVAAAWSEDGRYTDPLAGVSGHDGITALIAAVREQSPGLFFRPVGGVDGHHDTARFSWELVSESDGTAPVAGSDVITLDGRGRITSLFGFLDRMPAGA